MTDSIVAKVAAIMDDTTLVLNAGSQSGVMEGMLFDIVAQHQQITDPDTGASLGQWEVAKARVAVTHVQEKMCTVRTPLGAEVEASGTLSTLMVRHSFGLYDARKEGNRDALDVRAGSKAGRPVVVPIEVGDLARSVELSEFTETSAPAVAAMPQAGSSAPKLPSKTYDSYLKESSDRVDAAQPEPPQTDAPQTEPPQTDAPSTDQPSK
jgi:hypothetical protein